jgi:hypothetical protein
MTNDALLFEVIELIKAYETGLVKSYKNTPREADVDIGYLGPLTMMQSILEAEIKSGEAHLEISQGALVTHEVVKESPELENKIFSACSNFYDSNEKKTNDFVAVEASSSFKPGVGESFLKAKVTNKWVGRFDTKSLEEIVSGKLGNDGKFTLAGKDFNFGIEKCFNCFLKINLELILPPIEFLVDLSKLLNLLKGLLAQIKDDLDPTRLLDLICQFSFRFQENLLCPANLIGLSFILPSLFIKYSLDLLNFKIDATIAFGPIIKAAVSFIASLLENIPRLIFPIVDCLINAIKSIEGALRAIVGSAGKIISEGVSVAERVANKIADIVNDPKGYRIKEEQLEKIKEKLKENNIKLNNIETKREALVSLIEFIKEEYGYIESFENFKIMIIETLDLDLLKEYLEVENQTKSISENIDAQVKQLIPKEKELLDYNKRDIKIDVELGKANEQKKAILDSIPNRVSNFRNRGGAQITESTKTSFALSEYLSARFGISYLDEARVENEFDFTSAINQAFSSADKKILEFFGLLVKKLTELKDWISYYVNGAIGLMKSLELFISEHIAADIKVLGDIRELLHMIRLVRLAIELISNGLSNCDKIKENKKVFKDILEAQNFGIIVDNLSSNDILNINNANPDDFLVIRTTDNMQRNIINLNDCGEAMSALGNKDLDLDSIYDSIRRNAIV